ncbi:kinase-like domain-containing protein [Rhizophagus irregularis DAOM 181602=DAOM 197198]|nr:kinase-like domain-containing protein [Rhizophagus irregularis DAOM 181602=DAOM 197198]
MYCKSHNTKNVKKIFFWNIHFKAVHWCSSYNRLFLFKILSNNLETLISEGCIEYYEYSDFKNIQLIGKGASGSVTRATWKDTTTRFFALKSFNNDKQTHKEIVKELTLHRKVDIHENILRFYGISSVEPDEMNQMKKYYLVLEYADSDTLNTYLNNHFDELNWNDKLRLAFQLTSAVECIHCCGIIHRDLHAKNILIHQKSIKLADFGLSKKISEESSNAKKVFGVVPYIDPKSLDDQKYKLNEKSDIYGIGVLMWQISSGRQPFKDKGFDYDVQLSIAIINGLREEIIDKTPVEYSNLYKECWKNEPNNRPNIQKVVLTLKAIISPKQDNTINENFSEESVIDSSEKYQTISDIIPDINEDLSIDSNIGVNSSNDFSNDKPDISTQRNSAQLINIVDSKKSESSSSNALNKRINPSCRNAIELALEEDGFTTLDEKAKELIKKLTETKYLQALKLLIENLQNEFTPQILRDTLVALADPTSFDYYAKQSVARLELHLRTWAEVLERKYITKQHK